MGSIVARTNNIVKGGNRPGGILCSACNVITEYRQMVRVRRKWYCHICRARMEHYGIWPPG